MKKILIFSNMDQIGDGIIKLPFIHEIKKRFPEHCLIWATNTGNTVYKSSLKHISNEYIDQIYEKVPLKYFFFRKKNTFFDLQQNFDIIIDTQKAFIRTLILKRLNSNIFISSSANWIFSTIKPKNVSSKRKFYLDDLFFMLDLISKPSNSNKFEIKFPSLLINSLNNIFDKNKSYIGFAPGSATKERIWKLDNYISVAKYFSNKNYIPTFFLGPNEKKYKQKIIDNVPNSYFPEELINNFSGPEVVMACTNFLSCSIGNDAGTTQMLSCGNSPLIKLIGPSNATKFSPNKENLYIIDSKNYGNKNINLIPINDVIKLIEKIL